MLDQNSIKKITLIDNVPLLEDWLKVTSDQKVKIPYTFRATDPSTLSQFILYRIFTVITKMIKMVKKISKILINSKKK